ncbi:MAG: 2-oxoglutarate ferredoxin oxidoreductase subunit beta, partial [Phycisphaerae bacterium]
GLEHKGISVIDAISNCQIQWGGRNKLGNPVALVDHIRNITVSRNNAKTLSPEELVGKMITGIFVDDTGKKEYVQAYYELVQEVSGKVAV